MKLIKNQLFQILSLAAVILCMQTVIIVAQDGAESVISVQQGVRQDFGVIDPSRSNPQNALGKVTDPPANVEEPFFSLGFAPMNGTPGTITLGFRCRIVNNATGPDVSVFENTNPSDTGPYPLERAMVEALDPNTGLFVPIGFAGNEDQANTGGITRTDLDLGSLPYTLQIRVTDVTVRGDHDATADGFDLNAVEAITSDCGTMPSVGQFVIGDLVPFATGDTVYYWGAQWIQNNPLTGGIHPGAHSFKGFQNSLEMPTCGDTWSSRPGNSTPPPPTVPAVMDVIVSSNVTKSGPILSGDIVRIVRITTLPGYQPNPGHPGMGTVTEVVCDVNAPIVPKSFYKRSVVAE